MGLTCTVVYIHVAESFVFCLLRKKLNSHSFSHVGISGIANFCRNYYKCYLNSKLWKSILKINSWLYACVKDVFKKTLTRD